MNGTVVEFISGEVIHGGHGKIHGAQLGVRLSDGSISDIMLTPESVPSLKKAVAALEATLKSLGG